MALPVSCFAALAAVVRAGTPSVLLGFVLAAAAPFAVEAFAFERAHAFAAFYDANVGATLRRAQHRPDRFGRAPLGSVVDQFRILAPPLQLAFLSPLAQRSRLLWVSAGWLAAAAAGIAVTGEFYARQFVLVHAPLSLLGAIGATALATRLDRKRLVMTLALLTAFAMHDYYNARVNLQMAYAKYAHRKAPSASDPFAEGRARLKAIVGLHSLYIINESPLLYDELNATSPTRYPLSADLLERNMWAMLGFSGERELDRVLNQRPAFVLVGAQGARDDAATYAAFMQRLQQEYEFREALSIGRLYRLRADSRLSRSSIQ